MPTITITLNAGQYNRVQKALGKYLHRNEVSINNRRGPQDANDQEVKSFLLAAINSVVKEEERNEARANVPEPADVEE